MSIDGDEDEPDAGPVRLEVTGPEGAQEFVEALLESR
jgi:hypothetical protein